MKAVSQYHMNAQNCCTRIIYFLRIVYTIQMLCEVIFFLMYKMYTCLN